MEKRRLQPILVATRKQVFRVIIISATVLVLALLYFFVDARHSGFFPACPLFTLTGLYCPGCGSQRAVSALLHGDIFEAIDYNVMLVVSTPLVLYSAVITVTNIFRDKPLAQKIFYSPLFVRIFLVTVLMFGVLRNIHVYPFVLLAP
jgi:hypothetical protein